MDFLELLEKQIDTFASEGFLTKDREVKAATSYYTKIADIYALPETSITKFCNFLIERFGTGQLDYTLVTSWAKLFKANDFTKVDEKSRTIIDKLFTEGTVIDDDDKDEDKVKKLTEEDEEEVIEPEPPKEEPKEDKEEPKEPEAKIEDDDDDKDEDDDDASEGGKVFVGSTVDRTFYAVLGDDKGNFVVQDAEGKEIFTKSKDELATETKTTGFSPTTQFLLDAIPETGLEEFSYSLFTDYFYPEMIKQIEKTENELEEPDGDELGSGDDTPVEDEDIDFEEDIENESVSVKVNDKLITYKKTTLESLFPETKELKEQVAKLVKVIKESMKDKDVIEEKELTVPQKHQLKIAKKTLTMSDAGALISGGMTKEEAREVIRKLTGREPKED
jgi:hypothetical protein